MQRDSSTKFTGLHKGKQNYDFANQLYKLITHPITELNYKKKQIKKRLSLLICQYAFWSFCSPQTLAKFV